jgi:predicted RNA polymerase sigma factor
MDQDRRRWDRLLIRRGLDSLDRATAPGPYMLQASIAACHARAASPEDTDWHRIAGLYRDLVRRWPSPVARLNLAVAVGMADRPEAGLAIVDELDAEPALAGYPQLAAVRGDLLERLGRAAEARAAFERAAAQTRNESERTIFLRRATACGTA